MLDYAVLVKIQLCQLVKNCCLHVTVAKAYSDLNLFQKKHDVNPLRGFLVPLVQVSLYLCTGFPVSLEWSMTLADFFISHLHIVA